MPLDGWISRLLSIDAPAAAEDEAAFTAFRRDQLPNHARLLAVVAIAGAVAFWPTDLLLFATDPRLLRAFATWRAGVLLTAGVALGVIHLLRRHPVAVLVAGSALCVAGLMFPAVVLGRLDDAQRAWFPYFSVIPFCTVPLALSQRERAGLTLLAGVAPFWGFFPVAHDVDRGRLVVQVLIMAFAAMTSFLTGHLIFLLARANFIHRRTLEATVAAKTVELRRLAEHLLGARESERARIAREVHDELGGLFTAVRMEADRLAGGRPEGDLERLTDLVDRGLGTVRTVVADLRPRALDELGFAVAAEELFAAFEARSGVACVWEIDPPDLALDGDRALVAYRVLQESLTNVARHARARLVEVSVVRDGARVVVDLLDDGVGLPEGERAGFGLLAMRERVQSVGGTFRASRGPGERGTRIRAEL